MNVDTYDVAERIYQEAVGKWNSQHSQKVMTKKTFLIKCQNIIYENDT